MTNEERKFVADMRCWAAVELSALIAGFIGLGTGNQFFLFAGASVVGAQLVWRTSLGAFATFHLPNITLLAIAATLLGRPAWHGLPVSALLFSLLNAPLDLLVLCSPAEDVAERAPRD